MWKVDTSTIPLTAREVEPLVVKAFGYTDLAGKLQAAYILGTAQRTVFNEAISDIRKQHSAEIKAAASKLSKWGAPVSEAAIRDVISKVLMTHKIYPFPAIVGALAEPLAKQMNPFMQRGIVPSYTGDQTQYKSDQS